MRRLQDINILNLPDGRKMSYAEYGDPKGYPVMLFHGIPGSRLFWKIMPGFPFRPKLRLIAPDRPGYGFTDFEEGVTTLLNWPNDIKYLADSLGLKKFAILGNSGGGPYALACAWKIPERLSSVGIVSSMGPYLPEAKKGARIPLRIIFYLAPRLQKLTKNILKIISSVAHYSPIRIFRTVILGSYRDDRKILRRLDADLYIKQDIIESYRQNGRGEAYDITIPAKWPIPLNEIKVKILLWQGEKDCTMGNTGHCLDNLLPNCESTFIPEAGHLWIYEHLGEVLDELVNQNGFFGFLSKILSKIKSRL